MTDIPPNIGVIPTAADEAQKSLATEYRNNIVEIQSKLFDKSAAYNNLIMVGGYAGAFTIWSYTKSSLTTTANVATALLIGFSLCVFIFFQVYKMAKSVLHYNEVRRLLNQSLPLPDFFEQFNTLQRRDAERTLQSGTISTAICLFLCALSSVGAMGILFYNFIAVLLCWPLWP
ncbi:MAG: hypothetical protein WC670_12755 [Pseudolabrys sp.]|jgi:hypothetical protein